MPLIENHPHLLLSGPVGEHSGQAMGKVIPLGKVLHRLPLWCQQLIAGAGYGGEQGGAIKEAQNFPGQIYCQMRIKVWGLPRGRNSRYTRRT